MVGPCGVVNEVEPNETRETAAAYAFGATINGCLNATATPEDEDWYELTAPADVTGGYVQVKLTNVGNGTIRGNVFSVADNAEIFNAYPANAGANLSLFFAAKAGEKYRLAIKNIFSVASPYKYTMQSTYTKVVDIYEPNDTRASAKPMVLATPINATLFAGHSGGNAPEDDAYADWYSMTLAANKAVQLKLENVPTSLNGHVLLYDSAGTEIAGKYSANEGASVTLDVPMADIPAAGTYYVLVKKIFQTGAGAPSGKGDTVPTHFTSAYKLTVTQP
jgi:hypothetical protein